MSVALIIRVSNFLNKKSYEPGFLKGLQCNDRPVLFGGKQFLGVAHSPAQKAGHASIAISTDERLPFLSHGEAIVTEKLLLHRAAKLKRTSLI